MTEFPIREALYVTGEEGWRAFESCPPKGYEPRRFHLQPGGALAIASVSRSRSYTNTGHQRTPRSVAPVNP
ncbi:hypothetical protein ABZT34_05580 [Streptomyces sp. NPDC005329]|uniref:hypothetical protein n=1 Tax=Streptomyces sp. NPDC005329 TaxID=3157034 RepID=UPI0033A87176